MSAVAAPSNTPTGVGNGAENGQPVQQSILYSALRSLLVFTLVQFFSRKYGLAPTVPSPEVPQGNQEDPHHASVSSSSSSSSSDGSIVDIVSDGGAIDGIKRKPIGVSNPPPAVTTDATNGNRNRRRRTPPRPTGCLWRPDTKMTLHVYITDVETIDPIRDCPQFRDTDRLLAHWHEHELSLHGKDTPSLPTATPNTPQTLIPGNNERHVNLTLPIPHRVQHNATHLYAHVCLLRNPTNTQQPHTTDDILLKTFPLTKHRRRRRVRDEKKLLATDDTTATHLTPMSDTTTDTGHDGQSPLTIAGRNRTHDQVLLYLKPSLTLQIVNVQSMHRFPSRESIPHQMEKYMDWREEVAGGGDMGVELFYPILYNSEFWIQTDSLIEVNDTMTATPYNTTITPNENDNDNDDGAIDEPSPNTVTLQLHLHDINMWRWQFMSQMEESWRVQEDLDADTGSSGGSGMDILRTMLLETNPVLLIITAIVSVFHTLFDILAFKNDIKFFKGKRSMEGISLRSMVVGVVCQAVVLLYLMDNETSFMVLASNGVGVAIECWKITKAVDISFKKREEIGGGGSNDDGGKGSRGFFGGWELQWEEKEGYKGSKTKEYDEIATSHLMYITTPLVTGFGVYSLLHQKHKGWYSWILNTLVGFIYMFGFVMMTPQLFINYKLQSVAHLNWRTLTYKSINTFIDDLFAFVIKMPIMHRLACLRDDVIFFIFCYQRYKYRTDYTRVNEFGQCEQPTEALLEEQQREHVGIAGNQEGERQSVSLVGEPQVAVDAGVVAPDGGTDTVRRRRGARDRVQRDGES